MPYDIPGHKFEAPQQGAPDEVEETLKEESKSTQKETAQIYRFLGLPKGLEDSPKDSRGNYLWWPETRADWNQRDPTLPPNGQRLKFPELFRDVMRVRQDVYVRELGAKQEDIASYLWHDSVSLHWVIYITDYVDSDSVILGPRKNQVNNKIRMQIPIGTVSCRPEVVMRSAEDKKREGPFVGVINCIRVTEPVVLTKYRHAHWIEDVLIKAVIEAFDAYRPPEFFYDIFGRVVPLNRDNLPDTRDPVRVAEVRREWRDQIVSVVPEALQWSGLMGVHADVRRQEWWWREASFRRNWAVKVRDSDDNPPNSGRIFLLRKFEKVVERRTSREVNLFKLSRAQREVFSITPTMVGGMELPSWQVRICPDQARREAKRKRED